MKAVGIKLLKNNLSKYLKEVQAGETVWITDREEVIAEMHRPTLPIPGKVTRWEAWLNAQERLGKIRRPQETDCAAEPDLPMPSTPFDLQALLEETREERS